MQHYTKGRFLGHIGYKQWSQRSRLAQVKLINAKNCVLVKWLRFGLSRQYWGRFLIMKRSYMAYTYLFLS